MVKISIIISNIIQGGVNMTKLYEEECAKAVKADYIITRNKIDFRFSDKKVVTPEEFLEVYMG